jgi:hypothetical protein
MGSGSTVCPNGLVKPIASVDAAVQGKLMADVLRPAIVRAIIDGVFEALQPTFVGKESARSRKTSRPST